MRASYNVSTNIKKEGKKTYQDAPREGGRHTTFVLVLVAVRHRRRYRRGTLPVVQM